MVVMVDPDVVIVTVDSVGCELVWVVWMIVVPDSVVPVKVVVSGFVVDG